VRVHVLQSDKVRSREREVILVQSINRSVVCMKWSLNHVACELERNVRGQVVVHGRPVVLKIIHPGPIPSPVPLSVIKLLCFERVTPAGDEPNKGPRYTKHT